MISSKTIMLASIVVAISISFLLIVFYTIMISSSTEIKNRTIHCREHMGWMMKDHCMRDGVELSL